MRILIAVDQSPHSERAVQFVSRMRWPAGSRVIVASVMTPPLSPPIAGVDPGVSLMVEVGPEQVAETWPRVTRARSCSAWSRTSAST